MIGDENATNATTSSRSTSITQDELLVYLRNLTRAGYDSYFTVFSPDYRLYLLENQLRLIKKYIRSLIDEHVNMIDAFKNYKQNQLLLEWTIINHDARLAALEGKNATQNATEPVANTTTSETSNISGGGRRL